MIDAPHNSKKKKRKEKKGEKESNTEREKCVSAQNALYIYYLFKYQLSNNI
jgi:hypothetical protein